MAINSTNMNLVGVKDGNNTNIIGKLVYYTIGRALVRDERIKDILQACGIDENMLQGKFTNIHAFKTATKALEIKKRNRDLGDGRNEMYRIRILDNEKEEDGDVIVREIKKEIIREKQNEMIHLGNFYFNRIVEKGNSEEPDPLRHKCPVSYDIRAGASNELNFDLDAECNKTVDLYEYAKFCYNENRIVNFIDSYVKCELDASPVSIHGKLYFVPRYKNDELAKLEQFIVMIDDENELDGNINFASIPVMSEDKYIREYTKEFYAMAEQEIETYQKRFAHFIEQEQASEKIINAWIDKVSKFINKKAKYEDVFKQSLNNLDDDIQIINRQIRELTIRAEKKRNEAALR